MAAGCRRRCPRCRYGRHSRHTVSYASADEWTPRQLNSASFAAATAAAADTPDVHNWYNEQTSDPLSVSLVKGSIDRR